MWPFKKRVAGTQGPDSPLEKVGRSPSGEWAGVPAIERTVTPLPTTIETTSFQADLAAQRPPAQFLKPLSHGLSPSGPSGLIGGLVMPARPTERAVRVQRSAVKFAPRPGGRWVTDLPAEVEQAGASDQTRLADPGPATAYPAAPEPPVQADPLPAPAPDAPKPAGGRPVLLRVDSDALPIVRLPSSPRPASPRVEAPVTPAPAGVEPARPQAPQAPAPGAGDLGTLGGEPEASQPAASTEAHPPSPLSSSGEPSRLSDSFDAPVQRRAASFQSAGTGTNPRPKPLPLPAPRPGRPLGLGPPLRSYDTVEPAGPPPSEPAQPEMGFPPPPAPALGSPAEPLALPIQRSSSPEPARFEHPASTDAQPGDAVVVDRPAVADRIAGEEAPAAEVQRFLAPGPELPLLGQPAAEEMAPPIDPPATQEPSRGPVGRSEATRQTRLDGDRPAPAGLPFQAAEEGPARLSRRAEPALPGAPLPETPTAPATLSPRTQTPGTSAPSLQRSEAGPPAQVADRAARPTLGSGDQTPHLSTREPVRPPEAEPPSEPMRLPELRGPDAAERVSAPGPEARHHRGEGLPKQTTSQEAAVELPEPETVPVLGSAPEPAIELPAAADSASLPATPLQRVQPRSIDSGPAEPRSRGTEKPSRSPIEASSPTAPGSSGDGDFAAPPPAKADAASKAVQRLDAASAAPGPHPAVEPVALPLLGSETEMVPAMPAPEPAAPPQAGSGPAGALPVQRDPASGPVLPGTPGDRPPLGEPTETWDRPLPGEVVEDHPSTRIPNDAPANLPLLGEAVEAVEAAETRPMLGEAVEAAGSLPMLGEAVETAETRPMLGEAVEAAGSLPTLGELSGPDLDTPQIQTTAAHPSGPEPVPAPRQAPIQRASFVERARSWAAGRSQSDFDPAPRHPESPVASRSAERPSASQTFERRVPERQIPQTGSRTPDLPGFRPPTLQREEETSRPGVQAHQPTLSGDATPTLQRPSEGSVPGPNIQEPPAAAATPEALPTPAPRDYSEIRRLVGQDPAPTTLRSEPESPRPSIQMSSAPAPAPPASFETVAGPSPAAPARATALPENRTIEFRQTGFPGPQVQTLGTPPAQFLPPTAQLPLVGEHLPAGLGGRPGSFPAPAGDQISTAPIQRSRTPAMGSAGPLPPAAANRTQNASPEPSPTAARDAFAAPYLPEAPSAPAVHAAPPQVQRAAGGQPSRDLYAAAAESAAAAAVAAGVASRGPDGALVFRSPEAAAPPVPTAPAPPPAPVPAPVPVQRVTATAPAKEAEQAEPEPPDLDELAMRLYPKLRPYLRKDLWLDRERSGLLADLR